MFGALREVRCGAACLDSGRDRLTRCSDADRDGQDNDSSHAAVGCAEPFDEAFPVFRQLASSITEPAHTT